MKRLNLNGIWIPLEILKDKNLSDKEKLIYSMIAFLGEKREYCYCTNSNVSELLNISITQVSKLINSLKNKNYIDIEMAYKENSKQIEIRKLKAKVNTTYLTEVKYPYYTKVQQPIKEKFKDNINNNKKLNNKYYISNQQKQKKKEVNFEQRDFTGFDFSKLYAN